MFETWTNLIVFFFLQMVTLQTSTFLFLLVSKAKVAKLMVSGHRLTYKRTLHFQLFNRFNDQALSHQKLCGNAGISENLCSILPRPMQSWWKKLFCIFVLFTWMHCVHEMPHHLLPMHITVLNTLYFCFYWSPDSKTEPKCTINRLMIVSMPCSSQLSGRQKPIWIQAVFPARNELPTRWE